jgi:PKD repeat protein
MLFNAGASDDPDGSIVRYDWDFGDGTTRTSGVGARFTHVFPRSGTFPVTLTVTDNEGATGTTTHDIVVSNH